MVLLRWTQRSACVPQALHLSSYPVSNGPAWVMALWGAGQDYCDRSHTLNPPNMQHSTQTHTGTWSYRSEGSESMVICLQREEQEHRLQEEDTGVTLHGCFVRLNKMHTCYLNRYLMVAHTDVRTHCVVNNVLLTVLSLKRDKDKFKATSFSPKVLIKLSSASHTYYFNQIMKLPLN